MSIHIHTEQVIIQQPPARSIHPDIAMNNPEFLKGYTIGLRSGLHPELTEDEPLSDEDILEAIRGCLTQEPDILPYIVGNLLGSIIAKCH
jgi:hypothetical protein